MLKHKQLDILYDHKNDKELILSGVDIKLETVEYIDVTYKNGVCKRFKFDSYKVDKPLPKPLLEETEKALHSDGFIFHDGLQRHIYLFPFASLEETRSKIIDIYKNYRVFIAIERRLITDIVERICHIKGYTLDELKSRHKSEEISMFRMCISYVLKRRVLNITLSLIGEIVGKHHATVLHHIRACDYAMGDKIYTTYDKKLRKEILDVLDLWDKQIDIIAETNKS